MYGTHQGEHPYARPLGHCPHARRRRSSASRAEIGDRDRLYGVEAAALSARPYSARHGRAAGVATGRAKIAGEIHPSVIGASQATARSPPYPDPKHITLYSQPVEGAIPNRWRANPEIKRPYGPGWVFVAVSKPKDKMQNCQSHRSPPLGATPHGPGQLPSDESALRRARF